MITANPTFLDEWSPGKIRSRWDYDVPDHTLEEMIAAGERYFANCIHLLRSGDIVYVTDAANARATLVVNLCDPVRRTIAWDIDVAHAEKIALPPEEGLAIRWRGPRGGRFAIVDRDGKVIVKDMMSREEAEIAIAGMRKAA